MYLQADLDWLIEREKQYPQENYIFFIHDKIEAIKHANNKEWAEYIDLFKDRIKKYDYNLALNEIKALPENRERIHK